MATQRKRHTDCIPVFHQPNFFSTTFNVRLYDKKRPPSRIRATGYLDYWILLDYKTKTITYSVYSHHGRTVYSNKKHHGPTSRAFLTSPRALRVQNLLAPAAAAEGFSRAVFPVVARMDARGLLDCSFVRRSSKIRLLCTYCRNLRLPLER
jgi:hypothetical protein